MVDLAADIVAETARLVLRGELPGDRAVWLAEINTPETTEHLGGVRSAKQVDEAFDKMAAPGEFPWPLVALRDEGTLLGKCGLGRIEVEGAPDALNGQVQIGWSIRHDHWRKGYGREAAIAMLDLAFGRYALEEVYAQCSERNVASHRLMEALGMTRRAELDYDDPAYPPEDNPTLVYAISRNEWLSR